MSFTPFLMKLSIVNVRVQARAERFQSGTNNTTMVFTFKNKVMFPTKILKDKNKGFVAENSTSINIMPCLQSI